MRISMKQFVQILILPGWSQSFPLIVWGMGSGGPAGPPTWKGRAWRHAGWEPVASMGPLPPSCLLRTRVPGKGSYESFVPCTVEIMISGETVEPHLHHTQRNYFQPFLFVQPSAWIHFLLATGNSLHSQLWSSRPAYCWGRRPFGSLFSIVRNSFVTQYRQLLIFQCTVYLWGYK